jgi:hypothetical protein
MEKLKSAINAAVEILGFDPRCQKETMFKVMMTPKMAQYILKHFNETNRKFVQAQLNAITNSVMEVGWLFTGGTCTFDLSGNLIEFQHRLILIARGDKSYPVWIATGVKKDTFEKAAPAKNRTKFDAIYRWDNNAVKDEVTTLEQLIKIRKGRGKQQRGCDNLDMTTALKLFRDWKDDIRVAMHITKDFFDGSVEKFNPWERTFNAWATLMVREGKKETVVEFLNLLKAHSTEPKKKVQLFVDMDSYFRGEEVGYLAGTKKTEQVIYMLCYATDRFMDFPKGNCEFGLSFARSNHIDMCSSKEKYGSKTYQSFLQNPQGLEIIK